MTTAHILIPARHASSRFPGKPLADLGGQTVLARVVRAALQSRAARPVFVATDDARISAEVEAHFSPDAARVVLTSPDCHTGTDRLAEAVRALKLLLDGRQLVVNVQGDEPFLDPRHIDALLDLMSAHPDLRMGTLATPLQSGPQFHDPNVVKVVVAGHRALYFSRAPIPHDRDGVGRALPLRHLGIYAYEANWLLEMAALPPSPLEEIERLEQLRALEAGVSIGVAVVENVVPIAIDTPEDLARGRRYLRQIECAHLPGIHCSNCGKLLADYLPETDNHSIPPEELFAKGAVPVPNFGWFCSQFCATQWEADRGLISFQRDEKGDVRYYP